MDLPPLPPNTPQPLQALREAAKEQDVPTYPHRVFAAPEISLPAASSYTSCQVWVTDRKILAVSDGTTWINVATGSAI